jgi:dTDP-glucose 4,6-dehydratase
LYDGSDGCRPDRYNIPGDLELDNLELAQLIASHLAKPLRYRLVDHHTSRPGHDRRYALDGSKITELGWTPPVPLEKALRKVIDWRQLPAG